MAYGLTAMQLTRHSVARCEPFAWWHNTSAIGSDSKGLTLGLPNRPRHARASSMHNGKSVESFSGHGTNTSMRTIGPYLLVPVS